jgi:cephalosporin hydroxylase
MREAPVGNEIMTVVRDVLINAIWGGHDPYFGFPKSIYAKDLHGWNSQHHYLSQSIDKLRPQVIVEVGVWKGGSSIFMASKLKELRLNAALVSIDTWLDSVEHWRAPEWREMLGFEFGRPSIMNTFLKNVLDEKLDDIIVPLPLDSMNAAHLLSALGIVPDIIHLDGGHDQIMVLADIETWWPILRPGGYFIGDDYAPESTWVGVKQAFDGYFNARGLGNVEFQHGKCRIRKPLDR